jgi:hypothetical protein
LSKKGSLKINLKFFRLQKKTIMPVLKKSLASYSKPKSKKPKKVSRKKASKKTSKRKVKKSSLVKAKKSSKTKTMKRAVSYESTGPGVHTDWKGKKGNPLIPHVGDLENGHTGTRWFGTEVDWS